MGKRIIECSVSDEYLLGGGVPIGAAGSHDDVVLRLAFGDTWAGLNIYATFTDALGQQSIVVLLLPSMLVPGEAMTYDVPIPAVAKRESGISLRRSIRNQRRFLLRLCKRDMIKSLKYGTELAVASTPNSSRNGTARLARTERLPSLKRRAVTNTTLSCPRCARRVYLCLRQ